MRKKIKDYWLVFDAFGNMPLWSIQHPTKEVGDSYLLFPNESKTCKTEWFREIKRLQQALDKLYPYYVSITGKMTYIYSQKFKDRIVSDLKIDKIILIPDEGNPINL